MLYVFIHCRNHKLEQPVGGPVFATDIAYIFVLLSSL